MVFERPKKRNVNSPNTTPPNQGGNSNTGRRVIPAPNTDNRGGGDDIPPSPWLKESQQPSSQASFVEYLRWMRPPGGEQKDTTKLQILQMATEGADYQQRLKLLNQRTKAIAGENNWFVAKSAWRIRVGGHKGPENILLPAFDALGMPYLPASTLRGVARNQAIRHFMVADSLDWEAAEQKVAAYFGSLSAAGADRSGKVIFLDAYPDGNQSSSGLAVDMANSIWKWEDAQLKYDPNPNAFLSLHQAKFIIGIRPMASCKPEVLNQVRTWLMEGLCHGVGSQINTGYGSFATTEQSIQRSFLKIDFKVQGQLVHGQQEFKNVREPYQRDHNTNKFKRDPKGNLKSTGKGFAEVRPVAFKSMLRYWFRTMALGVLSPDQVKEWEARIFGSITPQKLGWLRVQVLDGRIEYAEARNRDDDYGEQVGKLLLSFSAEAPVAVRSDLEQLMKNLAWLMFHLGGVGQGARRPCYSRQNRPSAPWWRGSSLVVENEDMFWDLEGSIDDLQNLFQRRLTAFYGALRLLTTNTQQQTRSIGTVANDHWAEALDSNAVMLLCMGQEVHKKPYALDVLHSDDFKIRGNYDSNLCGSTTTKPVKPSPVWIANFVDFQVVTIFGVNGTHDNPRQKFLDTLRKNNDGCRQIHPID
jgi:CRISPR-associated protein Cmr6